LHLDFGGSYQFRCDFRLKHEELEGHGLYSLGYMLGFGGGGWDDVGRATLEADAEKALRLCQALRSFFQCARRVVAQAELVEFYARIILDLLRIEHGLRVSGLFSAISAAC